MSGFLFNRQAPAARAQADEDNARNLRALVETQSITASAIFAMLVSKGVLTGAEAADYMRELGEALARDVDSPLAAAAADTLSTYAEALRAADG
ncbi:MAG TPA: hypothetical protein VF552_13735 [Allosphingosinicella sp.]|jgi:hypothetical protein